MKNNPYHFFDQLILRVPRIPATLKSFSDANLKTALENPTIMEALYLASGSTYSKALKWRDGEELTTKELDRLRETLIKYLIRMSNRCTPFALFAGCGIVSWTEDAEKIIVDPLAKIQKSNRIDSLLMDHLKSIFLSHNVLRQAIEFFPNSTLYQIGDKLRYVDYVYEKETRKHSISKVDTNEYLTLILENAKKGKTINALAECIVIDDITLESATEFIETLVDEKLLVSVFELSTSQKNHARHMLNRASEIATKTNDEPLSKLCANLANLLTELEALDNQVEPNPDQYQSIVEKLVRQFASSDSLKNAIQTDLIYDFNGAGISQTFQNELMEAFTVLNKLSAKRDIKIEEFAKKFYRRYGDAEIPLLEALDHDLGIGYKNYNNEQFDNNPLLDAFIFKEKNRTNEYLIWNKIEDFLHNKYESALKSGAFVVQIEPSELDSFDLNWDDLPDTLSLIFSHVGHVDGKDTILLKSGGGINGSYLLGRFAFADPKIEELCKKITDYECDSNENVVLADVNHVPQLRDVNVMIHPNHYGYEIAYLASTPNESTKTIPLTDLMISSHNNQVFLRSKMLNKRIIPRINSAHNYHQSVSHHIYSFLGDLQFQGIRPVVHFEWDTLSSRKTFLPRVMVKNVIVSPAKWKFDIDQVTFLGKNKKIDFDLIDQWREEWQIPQFVELVENRDNKLKIDLKNAEHIKLVKAVLEKNLIIDLEEFLFDEDHALVLDQYGKPYRNEFMAALFQDKKKQNSFTQKRINDYLNLQKISETVKRKFNPGSEWVFYEFYCGFRSSDVLLFEHIAPLMEKLINEEKIIKWFFIRFNVPENHVRLRMLLADQLRIGEITSAISQITEQLIADRIISKTQVCTYDRELERYGSRNIEQSESIFYYDSVSAVKILQLLKTEGDESLRWLIALRNVQALMDDFEWNLASKIDFFENLSTSFAREFDLDKDLKKQLNSHYRKFTSEIEDALETDTTNPFWMAVDRILKWRSEQSSSISSAIVQKQVTKELEVSIQSLTASYVHMSLNRLFKSQPRLQEMIVYYMLAKYYNAKLARQKKQTLTV